MSTAGRGQIDPDADGGIVLVGVDVVLGERSDDGVFEGADVSAYGESMIVQADDGIGDELAWAVESDVAAAVGFYDFDV